MCKAQCQPRVLQPGARLAVDGLLARAPCGALESCDEPAGGGVERPSPLFSHDSHAVLSCLFCSVLELHRSKFSESKSLSPFWNGLFCYTANGLRFKSLLERPILALRPTHRTAHTARGTARTFDTNDTWLESATRGAPHTSTTYTQWPPIIDLNTPHRDLPPHTTSGSTLSTPLPKPCS